MSRNEYFAYGSNLNFEQMAYRCPEATVVGTAKLDGYELAFRRGFLTILPKEGASVEGLIWSVTDHDESQLDCYEGYPTFYDKETMTVTDADGAPHEIMVYTMNEPYRDQLLPVSSRYNAVVLQGCLDAGISPQQFYDADEKYRKPTTARAQSAATFCCVRIFCCSADTSSRQNSYGKTILKLWMNCWPTRKMQKSKSNSLPASAKFCIAKSVSRNVPRGKKKSNH